MSSEVGEVNLQQLDELIQEYCTDEWKELLLQHQVEVIYPKGVLIFKEGELATNINIIKQGKVKVFSTFSEGKRRIIRLASDGQVLGHRAFGDNFSYSVSAATLEEVKLVHIPIAVFQNVLKANSQFCFHFMMFFAEELRASERQIKNLTNMNVRQRMCNAILTNLKAFGYDSKGSKKLSHTITRQELADIAGTTYESTIRMLSDLDKEGIIKIVGKQIEILKEAELRNIVLERV